MNKKRDMDLIRVIVPEIENGKDWFETTSDDAAEALGIDGTGFSETDRERLE